MTQSFNEIILVPTDFTETCQNAIDHAVNVASITETKITLLHVINKESRARLKKEGKGIETILEKLQAIQLDISSKYDIEVNYIAREGSIFEVINDVAKEIRSRMLVLGTRGKKGLQYLLGSYAFRVISQSPTPVLVVQDKSKTRTLNTILYPLNLFTEPRQMVPNAIRTSRLFGARIVIFRQKSTDPAESSKIRIISGQIERELANNEVEFDVTDAAKESGFANQLLDFAEERNVDLILMMTDSSIDNPDFSNSAWSEKLIYNEAAIPVLCINPVYLGEIFYTF